VHTYVDLTFTPEGVSPLEVAERLHRTAGLTFIVGPHDIVFEWADVEQFRETLGKIHAALRGSGVTYRVESTVEDPMFEEPTAWPPALHGGPTRHPGYPKGTP
jgi:hypothetical protein